jgi:hypothetical protein
LVIIATGIFPFFVHDADRSVIDEMIDMQEKTTQNLGFIMNHTIHGINYK